MTVATVFTSTGTWTKPAPAAPTGKGPIGFATKATVPAPKPSGLVVVTRSPLVVVTR